MFEMAGTRLRDAGGTNEFDKSQLDSVVAILLFDLSLNHDARSGLNHSDRNHSTVRIEDLRHPHLNSD